jgi:small-conductance mechanosensitive channel
MLILIVLALIAVRVYLHLIINTYFSNFLLDEQYISEGLTAIIAALGAYVVYKACIAILNAYSFRHGMDEGSAWISKLILRVLLYAIVIIVVLTAFGINLTDALAGGAIGGVVLGLAVQTIVSSILAGFLVSSSRAVFPGEVLLMRSSYWGGVDLVCKVTKTSVLFTYVQTPNGSTMKLPNSILFNYTVFTTLRTEDGSMRYPFSVTINADVPGSEVIGIARRKVTDLFVEQQLQVPEMYLTAKNGSTDTYTVLLCFKKYSELNKLINSVNNAFDEAYWELKGRPEQRQKKKR